MPAFLGGHAACLVLAAKWNTMLDCPFGEHEVTRGDLYGVLRPAVVGLSEYFSLLVELSGLVMTARM